MRDSSDSSHVVASTAALIQKDGDIVSTDGTSNVTIPGVIPGNYFVVVKHRNHLGVMTNTSISLDTLGSNPIDFTSTSTATYGTSGQSVAEA